MTKYVNVPLHQIALEALTAATLKKTHPELFDPSHSNLGGLGMNAHTHFMRIRAAQNRGMVNTIMAAYTVGKGAQDVITIIRNAVNNGWLDKKYLAPNWDFYTRADQLAINAANAMVGIQITMKNHPKDTALYGRIRDGFIFPMNKVLSQLAVYGGFAGVASPQIMNEMLHGGPLIAMASISGGTKSHVMSKLGITSKQADLLGASINLWKKTSTKIWDMFDAAGMYKGQGWLSAVLTIVAGVAAVAAPALLFASSGIGAAGAGAGAAAASGGTAASTAATTAATTAASTAATTAAATVGTTASTAAAVAGGAKAAADLAKGGTSAATKAIKTTTSAIKTGGTLASHVGDVIQSSGIVKDALPIAQAVLSQQGVNTQDPQTQAALQKAMQEAQNAASTQMLNGNVKTNPHQTAPATTFSWSKMLPIMLSGGAILLETLKK